MSENVHSHTDTPSTLAENAGGVLFGLALIFGGGLVAVTCDAEWLKAAGGLVGIFGFITTNMMFWSTIKCLFKGT